MCTITYALEFKNYYLKRMMKIQRAQKARIIILLQQPVFGDIQNSFPYKIEEPNPDKI